MWFLIIVLVDQLVKYWVEKTQMSIAIWDNVFNMIYVQNTGGIYGMFQGKNTVFAVISIAIILLVLFYVYHEKEKSRVQFILWQFVIAGGLSNTIDRLTRGHVVDFIQLKFFGVFNLSDACIVCGMIGIIFLEIKELINEYHRNRSNR